jgi:hypothetical protein
MCGSILELDKDEHFVGTATYSMHIILHLASLCRLARLGLAHAALFACI